MGWVLAAYLLGRMAGSSPAPSHGSGDPIGPGLCAHIKYGDTKALRECMPGFFKPKESNRWWAPKNVQFHYHRPTKTQQEKP